MTHALFQQASGLHACYVLRNLDSLILCLLYVLPNKASYFYIYQANLLNLSPNSLSKQPLLVWNIFIEQTALALLTANSNLQYMLSGYCKFSPLGGAQVDTSSAPCQPPKAA